MTLTTLARTATRQVKSAAQETTRRAGSVGTGLSKRDFIALFAIAAGGYALFKDMKVRGEVDEPEW